MQPPVSRLNFLEASDLTRGIRYALDRAAVLMGAVVLGISHANDPRSLLAPPLDWVHALNATVAEAGSYHDTAARIDVQAAYLRMLASVLTSSSLMMCDAAAEIEAEYLECMKQYRGTGMWPQLGTTMVGHKRLQNVVNLLLAARTAGVPGSYAECGVWRGGMSIFAKAAIEVYQMKRHVYMCDSFRGLPPPRSGSLRSDETVYSSKLVNDSLAKGQDIVTHNFHRHGVPMDNVSLVPGFFVNSLPKLCAELKSRSEELALLRLDGDMYDSTISILYNLYELVAVGGFVIIDDFGWADGTDPSKPALYGAKDAVLDFRALHKIEDEPHAFHNIDDTGAWFRKARHIKVLRRQYVHSVQRGNYSRLRPTPLLTAEDCTRLQQRYEAHARQSTGKAGVHPDQHSHPRAGRSAAVNFTSQRLQREEGAGRRINAAWRFQVRDLIRRFQCHSVFLDVGSNVGVQVRKLYEPELYSGRDPQLPELAKRWGVYDEPTPAERAAGIVKGAVFWNFSSAVLPIFQEYFGAAPRCGVCAVGVEPNPRHSARHKEVQAALQAAGMGALWLSRTAADVSDGETAVNLASPGAKDINGVGLETIGTHGRRLEADQSKEQLVSVQTINLAMLVRVVHKELRAGSSPAASSDSSASRRRARPRCSWRAALGHCYEARYGGRRVQAPATPDCARRGLHCGFPLPRVAPRLAAHARAGAGAPEHTPRDRAL